MNAHVNSNCIGCGLCVGVCPDVFSMSDIGVAVAREEVPPDLEDSAQEAAGGCPVDAIELD